METPTSLNRVSLDVKVQGQIFSSYDVRNGVVYVYRITMWNEIQFYVATYYDFINETAWGFGFDEVEALENAEKLWNEVTGDSEYNPFHEVLNVHDVGEW